MAAHAARIQSMCAGGLRLIGRYNDRAMCAQSATALLKREVRGEVAGPRRRRWKILRPDSCLWARAAGVGHNRNILAPLNKAVCTQSGDLVFRDAVSREVSGGGPP